MSEASLPTQARLLTYDQRARWLLFAGVFASLLATLLVLVQALLLAEVVSGVFMRRQGLSDVSGLLLLMVIFAAARAVLASTGDMLAQAAAGRLKLHLRNDLTHHLTRLGPAFTNHECSGELVHVPVQGVEDLDEYVSAYLPLRWLTGLVPVFVLLLILLLDPFTVLILLLTGPVLVFLLVLIGSRAREATERRFREMSWTSAYLLDMLQGLATLKLFGRSREQAEAVRAISRRHGDVTMQVLRTAFETSFVLELCSALAVALVAVEVSLRLTEGALAFDRALAVLIVTPEFFLPLRRLSARYHAGAAGIAAGERIFALLDMPAAPPPVPTHPGALVDTLDGDIRFHAVSFAYAGRSPALDSISLTVPRGATLALVGHSGAGKTTLAHLLMGFLTPDSGTIAIGDAVLQPALLDAWRRQISWVPQHPYLFDGTVAENLRLARPHATQSQLETAARAAHAHDFIAALPRGYDTHIGEHGFRLSGGERQRLAIARAYLKDAPVLIFDEGTSHLDADTEAHVESALRLLLRGRTGVIVAHRERMARLAERVAVLDHGRLTSIGPPSNMLGRPEPSAVGELVR